MQILNDDKFVTPEVVVMKDNLTTINTYTIKGKDGEEDRIVTDRTILVRFEPDSNAEHKGFLNKLATLENFQQTSVSRSTFASTIKAAKSKNHDTGVYEAHATKKTLNIKAPLDAGVAYLEKEGERFIEPLDTNIPFGSTVVLEGTVTKWPKGDGTFNGRRGVSLSVNKVRILSRGLPQKTSSISTS